MKTDKLNKYGELLLLWILSAVCTSASVYIYLDTVINIWSVLGAVISAGVILFADFVRNKKFGGLLYAAVYMCVSFIPVFVIGDAFGLSDFIRWFFSGAEAVETRTGFIFLLTVMVSFLFTSAAYYFTKVIYRSSVIILITLIPFALAVKTVTNLPDGYIITASAANLLFFIYYSRKNITEGTISKDKSALVVYTDYAAAVILLALLLPKPSTAPYYEKFEELTNRFQIGGTSESIYTGEYKDSSGSTDDLRRGESVLIYLVSTSSPVYMKTQVFDIYTPETGLWTEADEMLGSKKWQEKASLLSFEQLGNALEKTLEASPELIDNYPQAEKLFSFTEAETFATVYAQEFPAVYILAPLRATKLMLSNVNAEFSARTDDGEIFTNNRLMPQDANYTIRYYTEDVFDWLVANGLCDLNIDEYKTFISHAIISSDYGTEENNITYEFYKQHKYAMEYAEKTKTTVSDKIQALADELTEGLEYDYQKAAAIEQYFHTGNFVYDLAYEAPEGMDTPEYFLFESKTGICSDYATAYTLLARAAGLTVRYVEGFVMQPSETTQNMYFIYTDNAHAYPEVYIPGAGWIVYEPTPSSITAAGEGDSDDERTDPLAILFTAIIAVCVIGIFILLMLLMPKILEAIFRAKIKFADANKAVVLLYNHHVSNMENKSELSFKAFTPEQLAKHTEDTTSLSLEPLVKPFISACYGGAKIGNEEKAAAFECYKAQYKALRKIKKRKD